MSLLEVHELSRHFGGLAAVNDLSFTVDEGAIHGLIGPNGAGKTTTFNVISGFYKPTAGDIVFGGRKISGLRPSRIAARGVVRTFQATTLFQETHRPGECADRLPHAVEGGARSARCWAPVVTPNGSRRRAP